MFRKKLIAGGVAFLLALSSTMYVCAAPAQSAAQKSAAPSVVSAAPEAVVTPLTEMDKQALRSIFDPVFYAASYPEVVVAVGSDPAKLWEYFCNVGIYQEQMANADFNPSA